MKATIDSCPLCSEWIRGTEKHFCVEKARVVTTEEVWELIGAASSTKLPAPADSQLPPEGQIPRSDDQSDDPQATGGSICTCYIPPVHADLPGEHHGVGCPYYVAGLGICPWCGVLTDNERHPGSCQERANRLEELRSTGSIASSIKVGTARASERRPRYDLLSLQPLLEALAARAEIGLKHGRDNWKQGDAAWIIDRVNHTVHHLAEWLEGKDDDDHLAAAAWGLYALLWHRANNQTEFNKARGRSDNND